MMATWIGADRFARKLREPVGAGALDRAFQERVARAAAAKSGHDDFHAQEFRVPLGFQPVAAEVGAVVQRLGRRRRRAAVAPRLRAIVRQDAARCASSASKATNETRAGATMRSGGRA